MPKVSSNSTTPSAVISGGSKLLSGPFPFTSMNQAIHGGNRDASFNPLPPPYPGKHPPVTISSPLLVNLLQNDGTKDTNNIKSPQQPMRIIRTPPTTSAQKVVKPTSSSPTTTMSAFTKPGKPIVTQADSMVSNCVSPSALSISNMSVRKHGSSILTSTSNRAPVKSPPPLPPQYQRGLVPTMVRLQAGTFNLL